jgi:A/G-specific adenine glycosylase
VGDPAATLILDWWASPGAARDLPWRRTRDPWAILVSEVMLQQTQVARVVPAYHRFLDRFPTVAACAAAPVGDVVRAWAGLGYNRRAVNLHRAATACEGRLPTDLAGLLALSGVGAYTARAVMAFAYEADVAVLDVNAVRVLSRLAGERVTQVAADALVPPGQGWAWNSALLDFGATVCTAASPRCGGCPAAAASACAWRRDGGRSVPDAGPDAGPDPGRRLSRQSTFEGSDRQGRGRLVAALRHGPVAVADAAATAGWPGEHERAARAVAGLVAEGLATLSADGESLTLP